MRKVQYKESKQQKLREKSILKSLQEAILNKRQIK